MGIRDSGPGTGVAYCCLGLCGLRVLKFDGAIAPRVLKFDSGFAAEGCCRAPLNYRRRPLMIKPNNRAFARGKTCQPGFARGNAFLPLVPPLRGGTMDA